ncbi:unnamed protein product [Allacma fusca]|uniref:Protein kinase domain-containing protein n=1 Tax=Allacma fusca TaxID=39272 RepID=A0A8J2PT22_9HEXA|nr:unnamed protein product [Allacma fusca]
MVVETGSSPPTSPPVSILSDSDVNSDRPSNVSLLANKYLLFDNGSNSTNTNKSSCVQKNFLRCIKIETKEQFSCKVVSRNQEGLQLVVGYHRLDEGCEAISKVHEVVLSPKCLYMIMPATFGNVHAYLLAKKKLREEEAANIFRQMVTAVQFCHSKGIVLRDLKMGKFVFHDRDRTLVRLDTLEDAVLLNDLNDDGLSDKHGCPNYVSPEKAEILRSNKKYPGKATDMWGLGVILYTLLVGRYPFNDEDHSKLFVKIRRGHYSIPENLSGSAKFLIKCLLQKDPKARPTCGVILKHSWLNSGIPQGSSTSSNVNCSRSLSSASISSVMSDSQPAIYDMLGNNSKQCYPKPNDSEDQVVPSIDMN